jgi:hypothetical protein
MVCRNCGGMRPQEAMTRGKSSSSAQAVMPLNVSGCRRFGPDAARNMVLTRPMAVS